MKQNSKRIVVGMSGGVDSTVTLLLLKRQGWNPVGVSLKLDSWKSKGIKNENACCTPESLNIAKEVCRRFGVQYHIYDVAKEFKREVMDYFLSELKRNRTPNPCVMCNRNLKFKKLFEWAKKHKIKYVATGHYARTKLNPLTGKYELLKAKDEKKDQTYALSFLPQKLLGRIVFPLGDLTKDEVYKIAEKNGLNVFLKKKQSQDLCFVSPKALPLYLKENISIKRGNIVNEKGDVLGNHEGIHFYTIGQRRRLGLSKKHYVKDFDIENNKVIVTENKENIGKKELILKPYKFISGEDINRRIRVEAKTRYGQSLSKAVLYPQSKGELRIVFDKPKDSPPGQFCVFYKGKVCLGAGIIN